MKKLSLFLFIFIFFIQLQAQNSFFIGERGYYLPEIENNFLSAAHPTIKFPPFHYRLYTNLSLGYKREICERYFIDFTYDFFLFESPYYNSITLHEYRSGVFKQYQLQGGYYFINSHNSRLGISTGVLYRHGETNIALAVLPNPNWLELSFSPISLTAFGLPLDVEYDFYPLKWFSIGVEAGGAIYFTKKQVFNRIDNELVYNDFKWNLYLGLRAGFHFGDPKFRKKK